MDIYLVFFGSACVVRIRRMREGEEKLASALARKVFSECVAFLYGEDGKKEFLRHSDPEAISERALKGHELFFAEDDEAGDAVGVMELKDGCHISMLFVEKARQKTGIGKSLLDRAREICGDSHADELTVHAAPNAVKAYRALGFSISGFERDINGIRFVPMKLRLKKQAAHRQAT